MKKSKILAIVLSVAVVAAGFAACSGKNKLKDNEEIVPVTVAVTDANGVEVTDESGELVTEVVTDINGEAVTQVVTVSNTNSNEDSANIGSLNTTASNQSSGGTVVTTSGAAATTKKDEKTTQAPVTKPSAPKNVGSIKASNITTDSLVLNWDKVDCTGYWLQYSKDGNMWSTIKDSTGATKFTVSGLESNTSYFFRVAAFNRNAAGKSLSKWTATTATTKVNTTSKKISFTVQLPIDSNASDTVEVYINGGKKPVLTQDVHLNSEEPIKLTTKDKYKGVVDFTVILKKKGWGVKGKTDKDIFIKIEKQGIHEIIDDVDW